MSTRKQVSIFKKMSIVLSKFPLKVAALAGRRPDALDAKTKRFPNNRIDQVKEALTIAFSEQKFTRLVCAAACGADLLALDVATALGLEKHVILPFSAALFRRVSVVDRPGKWGELYDRIIDVARREGHLHVLDFKENDEEAFRKTNERIVSTAQQLAHGSLATGVLVWDGQPHGEDDVTQQFAVACQQAGFDRIEISTLQNPAWLDHL